MQSFTSQDSALLLAIVEVDKEDRVQCQAQGCGHSVFKRIHVVLIGMEFKVLGSQCYQRLYGKELPNAAAPQYGSINGRLLTAEERLVLVENTAKFIEALESDRLEFERIAATNAARHQQHESEQAAAQPQMHTHQSVRRSQPPQHVPFDARSPSYEGSEMLRWHWRSSAVRASCVATFQANPSTGLHHAAVMACFKTTSRPTPYLFAMDVELAQCLPKPYILRALDELGLIEQR